MYRILPVRTVIPNVFFLHGDIVELKIFSGSNHLLTTELRAKDLESDEPLPNDGRYTLYLEDEWATVDQRAWPVTKREYTNIQWKLRRVMCSRTTPIFDAAQSRVLNV